MNKAEGNVITIIQNDNKQKTFPLALKDNVSQLRERIVKEFDIPSNAKWHLSDEGSHQIDLQKFLSKVEDSVTLLLHRSDIGIYSTNFQMIYCFVIRIEIQFHCLQDGYSSYTTPRPDE